MDENLKTPEDEMLAHDNLSHVLRMLKTMDAREATVLRMRFGLDDQEPRTLKEIGESLGLTRERVRQIETEALGKLAVSKRRAVKTDSGNLRRYGRCGTQQSHAERKFSQAQGLRPWVFSFCESRSEWRCAGGTDMVCVAQRSEAWSSLCAPEKLRPHSGLLSVPED